MVDRSTPPGSDGTGLFAGVVSEPESLSDLDGIVVAGSAGDLPTEVLATFPASIVAWAIMVVRSFAALVGWGGFLVGVAAGVEAFSGVAGAVAVESKGALETRVVGEAEAWIEARTIMADKLDPDDNAAGLLFTDGMAGEGGVAVSEVASSGVARTAGSVTSISAASSVEASIS